MTRMQAQAHVRGYGRPPVAWRAVAAMGASAFMLGFQAHGYLARQALAPGDSGPVPAEVVGGADAIDVWRRRGVDALIFDPRLSPGPVLRGPFDGFCEQFQTFTLTPYAPEEVCAPLARGI